MTTQAKIEALIWDVDGVLVDTEPLHGLAWQRLFQERGRPITLEDNLPLVICADDRPGIRRKPAPDLYLLAVEKLGLPADQCLAFEDSEPGVLAAKAAGCRCVALPHSFTLRQDFTAADLVIRPGESRDAAAILAYLGQP